MNDVIWLPEPPRTLADKLRYLEANHNDTCSWDACGCFDRLLAAVRGEPDPAGDDFGPPRPEFGPVLPSEEQWVAMGVKLASLPWQYRMYGYFKEAYSLSVGAE